MVYLLLVSYKPSYLMVKQLLICKFLMQKLLKGPAVSIQNNRDEFIQNHVLTFTYRSQIIFLL